MAQNDIRKDLLKKIADLHEVPEGAYNIRENAGCGGRQSTENIEIVGKEDGSGIDIIIKPGTKDENVFIPACVTKGNVHDLVYNDFHIGEGADVRIIAGCGIHNDDEEEAVIHGALDQHPLLGLLGDGMDGLGVDGILPLVAAVQTVSRRVP